jgi:hypothetical protein
LLLALVGGIALWRRRERELLLLLVATTWFPFIIAAVTRITLFDRFVTYVLPFLFVLIAVGVIALVETVSARRSVGVFAAVAVSAFGLFGLLRFSDLNSEWVALPWENAKTVGAIVDNADVERVLTNSRRRAVLDYYIGEDRLEALEGTQLNDELCSARGSLAFINHPIYGATPADTDCLARKGATMVRVNQRGRGGGFDVWLLGSRPQAP